MTTGHAIGAAWADEAPAADPAHHARGVDILFEPIAIGGLTLRNRCVMSPMTRCRSPGGVPSADSAAYYARRAAGGVGLVVTEGIGVDHPAALGMGTLGEANMPVLHGDAALALWRDVVAAVHAEGAAIVPQLWHQGPVRMPGTGMWPDVPSCRPSGIWGPPDGLTSTLPAYIDAVRPPIAPMSDGDIADTIAGFARSAGNAARCGFDGIALHGGHGYLLDSFLWAETNRRDDRWGGSPTNRARYAAEVTRAVRAAAPGLPVIFRLSQWKLQDYDARIAATPGELEALLAPLVDAGVDIFDASARVFDTPAFAGSPLSLAGWIRKVTGLPVIAVGSIGLDRELRRSFAEPVAASSNVEEAARRIAEGEFDMIGLGRALLADPAWVTATRRGTAPIPFTLSALLAAE
jgi:2,4-dienoyl-CoA reductase-like NADH-dependent reductase (Old Yellow Enzyme family)